MNIPISILLGITIGIVLGVLLALFFKRIHIRDTAKVLIILSISFLLVVAEDALTTPITFSALVGATVNIGYLGKVGIKAFLVIVGALLFRMLGAFAIDGTYKKWLSKEISFASEAD